MGKMFNPQRSDLERRLKAAKEYAAQCRAAAKRTVGRESEGYLRAAKDWEATAIALEAELKASHPGDGESLEPKDDED